MATASLILAVIGALIVLCATVQQFRLNPDDPKYNIGTGVAVTPPTPALGGRPLGAPVGAQVLHVAVPGARQLVLDQGRLTMVMASGAGLQFVAVVLALLAR
jgi:hypothetical protein